MIRGEGGSVRFISQHFIVFVHFFYFKSAVEWTTVRRLSRRALWLSPNLRRAYKYQYCNQ